MNFWFIDKKTVLSLLFLIFSLCVIGLYNVTSIYTAKSMENIPIYCVKTDKKQIAITFDSAWDDKDLEYILQTLKKYDCKSTFFVVGEFADKYPDYIKLMSKYGNEVANHSDSHPHMNSLTKEKMIEEMNTCDEKIKKLTNQKDVLFRAPYGEYNSLLVQTCKATNRFCIQWDVDSLDWKGLTADEITKRVLGRAKNGSIVLLHNGAEHTAKALPLILSELKNRGYEFITVSELIYKDNYTIDHTGMQIPK